MPLLGKAVMLLSFDVVEDAIAEHDEWHTREHFPERLSIPGFVRGSRWVSTNGKPGYFVMYEVDDLATLQSRAYIERLNHPSPWTARMMTHYRGMSRGFCSVSGSFGLGIGQAGLLLRFKPVPGREPSLRAWLIGEALPRLPARRGLGSAHLFEGSSTPPMTNEQRIRGTDAGVDWALFVTGYREDALAGLVHADLDRDRLEEHGGTVASETIYRLHYMLTDREVHA